MKMTDKMIADVLKDMVVVVDSREKSNSHILSYFEKNDIPYFVEKMDTADYTFVLPNYPKLDLDYAILIERKNSIDEICGNFTKERDRFTREFERVDQDCQNVHILVEGASWKKILNGTYRSKFPPKSLLASLFTWNARYNCPIWFSDKSEAGMVIHQILYYELRECLSWLQKSS